MKKLIIRWRNWRNKQWKDPIRFLYKGYGLTIWKWSGGWFPLTSLWFGNMRSIGYNIFHNGRGFEIVFPPYLVARVCTKGVIGWWYMNGKVYIKSRFLNYGLEYKKGF